MNKNHIAIFILFLFVIFGCGNAYAQVPLPTIPTPLTQENGTFDKILEQFFNITNVYQTRAVELAKRLFFGLAIIHVVWTGFKMAWSGADFQKFVAEIAKMMLFLGFFLALILNQDLALIVVTSFVEGANQITGVSTSGANAFDGTGGITPSGFMGVGNAIVLKAISNISIFKVGAAVLIGVSVILILLSFAMMTLRLIMAYVEAYLAVSAGFILLGFGGLSFTSDLAKKYIFYLISVGMKLFILLIILGIAKQILWDIASAWSFKNNSQILLTLSLSIILMGLAMSIPTMISGLISGQASSGGGELVSLGGAALGAASVAAFAKLKAASAATGGGGGGSGGAIKGAMSVLNNKGGNGKT